MIHGIVIFSLSIINQEGYQKQANNKLRTIVNFEE